MFVAGSPTSRGWLKIFSSTTGGEVTLGKTLSASGLSGPFGPSTIPSFPWTLALFFSQTNLERELHCSGADQGHLPSRVLQVPRGRATLCLAPAN